MKRHVPAHPNLGGRRSLARCPLPPNVSRPLPSPPGVPKLQAARDRQERVQTAERRGRESSGARGASKIICSPMGSDMRDARSVMCSKVRSIRPFLLLVRSLVPCQICDKGGDDGVWVLFLRTIGNETTILESDGLGEFCVSFFEPQLKMDNVPNCRLVVRSRDFAAANRAFSSRRETGSEHAPCCTPWSAFLMPWSSEICGNAIYLSASFFAR